MNNIYFLVSMIMIATCCHKPIEPDPPVPPTPKEDTIPVPRPDPAAKLLYNGIVLPSQWPPYRPYASNIDNGMVPFYLNDKPAIINISLGRQLFVDNFLINSTDLKRVYHYPEYYSANPVLSPEKEWEKSGNGGFAAPFSDGVWYDEKDQLFKMWYLGGGDAIGEFVTCYAESKDGITWIRPELNVVPGTNIVQKGKKRDSNSIWIDKLTTDANKRYKMFNIHDGEGNWKYHYYTSSDGKTWREQEASKAQADRSTVFYNPFRGVWVFSMRHGVRIDANTLIRARDYSENADPKAGTAEAVADLQKFWFGPWPGEHRHPDYPDVRPAIYNMDAIGYESILLGLFTVWSGPSNIICERDDVIKLNQIMVGYSRDGYNWHREDMTPFLPVSPDKNSWNYGNMQSAIGSPIIVGDKLYFYMSGRRVNDKNAEETTTGLAILRRDGFASMSGNGTLVTERLQFNGKYFFVNADVKGSLKVEILDTNGQVINGFSKNECEVIKTDSTKQKVQWSSCKDFSSLTGKNIKVKFYLEDGDLYAFWISQTEDGKSAGYTAGGGEDLSKYGMDI